MAYLFDGFQLFGKEQIETMTASSSTLANSLAKSWQTIAAETSDYSKKSFENSSAYLENLRGAKSFENAVQIQSDYAKTFSAGFFDYMKKTGELYSNLAKETFKPVETILAKAQTSKN